MKLVFIGDIVVKEARETFIKKIFYPINMPEKHINEVIKWLKIN